jgi:hypothetical protein
MSIIELIMGINDDALLAAIERDALHLVETAKKLPDVWRAVKPIRKNVSLEQMVIEQHTRPIEREAFFALAQNIGMDEPIDELLSSLTP